MNKLVMILSLIIPMFNYNAIAFAYNLNLLNYEYSNDIVTDEETEKSLVSIIDVNNETVSTGVIFEISGGGIYIFTSSYNLNNRSHFEIVFNGYIRKAGRLIGIAKAENVAVLRVEFFESPLISKVKYTNSDLINKGEEVKILSKSLTEDFETLQTNGLIADVGIKFEIIQGESAYGNLISSPSNVYSFGGGVYNEYNNLIGINVGKTFYSRESTLEHFSYMININEALIIAKQIKKQGEYKANKISFDIISLESLSLHDKEYFAVSEKAKYGVVIVSFNAVDYIFGELSQGMTIVRVNGVKVENEYDLHKQLIRYQKKCLLDLTVIKRNGKEVHYLAKI